MKFRFFLLDADYTVDEGKSIVRLYGVDERGKSVCVIDEYVPYLYAVPTKATKALVDKLKKVNAVTNVEIVERRLGQRTVEAVKVYAGVPSDLAHIRETIKRWKEIGKDGCYEYTLNFYRRYLIDKGLYPATWITVEGDREQKEWNFDVAVRAKSVKAASATKPVLRTLAFDIESYEEGGKARVIMASFFGEGLQKLYAYKKADYPKFVSLVKDERELLEKCVATITEYDPDVIITYNGDAFDFALLRERCDALKVPFNLGRDGSAVRFERRLRASAAHITGRVHVDLFPFVDNLFSFHLETEVLTLDAVAAEVLGDTKIEFEYQEMLSAWTKGHNLGKFAEYNLKDSELTWKLAKEFLPQLFEFSAVSGLTPFDASRSAYSQLVESYLMRQARAHQHIIPNQPKFAEIEERRARPAYVGGYVKEPIGGIHDNIAVVDFRSLYPSIIATHNISPETLNCHCCKEGYAVPESKDHFCKKQKGFYSSIIGGFIERRLETKKRLKSAKGQEAVDLRLQELVLKMITNAAYGYLGYAGSRWYSYECARAAAAWGRHYISTVIKEAEKEGLKVLYADTDSCFMTAAANTATKATTFTAKINKTLPGIMELEMRGIYPRGLFIPKGAGYGTAKKRYALMNADGSLVIRGLETVRRDWCKLAKRVQRDVLIFVLKNKDKKGALKYLRDIVKRLREGTIPIEELTIYEQLTKPLEEYKQIGPHVVAARKKRERGRPVGPEMVVMYIIVKGKGSISERAEPLEDVTRENVDAEYYINNQIIPAGMRVLQVLGVSEDEIRGTGAASLKRFMR